ncbi:MAG: DUF63 family protein, partial [Candidatus Thermoplasmatota archaeon]|nr:DUF63 family protein [Candidatus Thermoplasmatota archaeon]
MNVLEEWYDYERLVIQALALIMSLFFIGVFLGAMDVSNPLSDFVYTYYLDPIIGESTGDSGYNMVNTMTYGIVLAMFAVAMSGWLRHLGVDGSDKTLLALLPFVLWAALGEVVEDAEMFGEFFSAWFVSPGVHFQTAAWVIIAGWLGYSIHTSDASEEEKANRVKSASMIIIFSQFVIYSSSIEGKVDIDISLMILFSLVAFSSPHLLESSADAFDNIQRTVYFSGVGGCLVLFGALASYMATLELSDLNLWPVAVVIGAPILLCMFMLEQGREAASKLASHGIVAGVLPPGMNEDEYQALESEQKNLIESLRLKATMAYPVAFLPVAGQLMDGAATYIGIDFFGYTEKHIVSEITVNLFDTALTFAFLKLGIGGVVFWFYTMANFEYRQQHLRLLIGLALMVVGMAPGLR